MSGDSLRDDLDLAERENTNLRRHLLWAASLLSATDRRELSRRIKRQISDGGVVGDQDADDRAEDIERDKAIEALTDHVQKAIEAGTDGNWIGKADFLANQLRGFLRPRADLTFHELHNPETAA